ncbi:hypothetical protein [Kribbella sp.]|uniref:hypothetical protein n=1 Tax=Kribbella sp. TaxID=1871183 RepID=UPI002D53B03D|nr:hypothetical protein [Kribbella sp.]HZX07202.1 hypothetical protein [Kribbella sp.]
MDENGRTELVAAMRYHAAEAMQALEDAGVVHRRTVLDVSPRFFIAVAAAWGDLAAWWPQPGLENRPLGDVLKVIPSDTAARVVERLVWGGLLADGNDPDEG